MSSRFGGLLQSDWHCSLEKNSLLVVGVASPRLGLQPDLAVLVGKQPERKPWSAASEPAPSSRSRQTREQPFGQNICDAAAADEDGFLCQPWRERRNAVQRRHWLRAGGGTRCDWSVGLGAAAAIGEIGRFDLWGVKTWKPLKNFSGQQPGYDKSFH